MLSLRAGYLQARSATETGTPLIGGFGGGIGLNWKRFNLDYSMTPAGELGNLQRISFRARF